MFKKMDDNGVNADDDVKDTDAYSDVKFLWSSTCLWDATETS